VTPLEPQVVSRRAVHKAMDLYLGHHDHAPQEGQPAPGFVIAALEFAMEQEELPELLPNSMLISNEWQFERRLIVGEVLRSEALVADVSERFGGKFGYTITIRSEIVLTGSDDRVAARSVRTMMYYDPTNARDEDAS
jgi:hypothetical protein